jgi:hypothetical protein
MRIDPYSHLIPPAVRVAIATLALLLSGCEGSSVVGIGADAGMDAALDVSCAAGQSTCGGACVDTRSSAVHCGACGNACAPGNLCVNGACMQSCPGMQTLCNGNLCVSTSTDRAHCGGCGNVCDRAGVLQRPLRRRVRAGASDLRGGERRRRGHRRRRRARYCADPQSDRNNCGACGNACPSGRICERGACVVSCLDGQTLCGGACRDLQSDRAQLRRLRQRLRERAGVLQRYVPGELRRRAGGVHGRLPRPAERHAELRRLRAGVRRGPGVQPQ